MDGGDAFGWGGRLLNGGDAFEFVELLQKINKFNHPQLSCRFSRLAE